MASTEALHIALDDELEHLVLLVGNGFEEIFERDPGAALRACRAGVCRADSPPVRAPSFSFFRT